MQTQASNLQDLMNIYKKIIQVEVDKYIAPQSLHSVRILISAYCYFKNNLSIGFFLISSEFY
jgi:hypothetical protein